MEIEKLTEQELSSTKGGGKWVHIGDKWYWIDTLDYDPEEDI